MAIGALAVAMSSDVAHSHGMGRKSGVVCPYGQVFVCFASYCNCYDDSEQMKAKRESIRRQKALKRVTNPCRVEPCSPGAAGRSGSSAIDRLGGGSSGPSGGAGGGGGSTAKSSASGGASSAPAGGSSAPIGTNTFMKPGGTSPGQGQSPGLR